jgi:hypothetical protein
LESVYTGNRIVGSNPTPSARAFSRLILRSQIALPKCAILAFWCVNSGLWSCAAEPKSLSLALFSLKLCTFAREYGFCGALNFNAFYRVPARSNLNRTRYGKSWIRWFEIAAFDRGKTIFNGTAKCSTCHVPPLFTEPGNNLHAPSEIGVDSFQADRSPTHMYRTAPLSGLWTHQKGGFYHDGRFASLLDVVDHYDTQFHLNLSDADKKDLIEYLKGI